MTVNQNLLLSSPSRADIQSFVRFFLDDANTGRTWYNWQINQGINLAMRQLQKDIILLDKGWFESIVSFGLTTNTIEYTLPNEIQRVIRVEYLSDDGMVTELAGAYHTDLKVNASGSGVTGIPQYYYLKGRRTIGLYPPPASDVDYDANTGGPIRIHMVERVPTFQEIDSPIYYDPSLTRQRTGSAGTQTFGTADTQRQVVTGPMLGFNITQEAADASYETSSGSLEFIYQFVRRDENKGRWSHPIVTGIPFVDKANIAVPQGLDGDLSWWLAFTDWPKGDPNDTQWPEGATHLDIWAVYVDNSLLPRRDMIFLGNLIAEDDYADGNFEVGWLHANDASAIGVKAGIGVRGATIYDGREWSNASLAGAVYNTDDHHARWQQMFPPSPYPDFANWGPGGTYTGTARYHYTNPAKGDFDVYHPDFFEEHVEFAAALAAIKVLMKHRQDAPLLARHVDALKEDVLGNYGARETRPRVINISNPDISNVSQGARMNHPGLRG